MRRMALTCALVCTCLGAQAEVSVVDDSGATVRLAQPAQRIVTLAPHMAETVFAAGAGEKLVGAVEYSDYPAAARKVRQRYIFPMAENHVSWRRVSAS